MSLFSALMGDFESDPIMRGHVRRMHSMMGSFFRDPFTDMMGRSMGTELMPFGGGQGGHELARYGDFGMGFPMMPMGFPNIGNMFEGMGPNPNCHSFSSSTVMTMTPGPDGRPQVYQASQSVKQGPGGVRETKKTVSDTRTGVKKMAIGHHINDRAHIIEREQNVYSGEHEERQDFINLEEEEAEVFNKEWETKSRNAMRHNAIEYGSRRRAMREPQLALPSTAPTNNSRHYPRSRPASYHSSSKPSTSALVASGSEEEESEEEEEVEEEKGRGVVGEKRKCPQEEDVSSEDEADEPPQPKKPMTTKPNTHSKPSSSSSQTSN